jgi:diaminopimelate decarboxylase
MPLPEHLRRGSDGRLFVEGVPLEDVASQFGTPLYVVSAAALRHAGRGLQRLVETYCEGGLACYAFKANSLGSICTLLTEEGIGAEISSFMELRTALGIGVPPTRIIFNGPAKSEEVLRAALDAEIRYLNADSLVELQHINHIAMERGRVAEVGLRIGPSVSKDLHGRPPRFGVDCADGLALQCLRDARQLNWVKICGVQFHLGTQIGSIQPFSSAIAEAMEFISRGLDEDLLEARYLSIGGGFAVVSSTCRPEVEDYQAKQVDQDLVRRVLEQATRITETLTPRPQIIIEPGRLLVASAVFLLTKVVSELTHKVNTGFVLDAGQSMVSSNLGLNIFHDVLPVRVAIDARKFPINLYGCLCYESDIIALRLPLPWLALDDLLAILDCGAYDMPLASSFIVPRPAVVLVDKYQITCVRRADIGD